MPRLPPAAGLILLLGLAGCFTVDATLDANGAGTIDLDYIPDGQATVESETARFSSAHVKVREITPKSDVGAVLKATFDDVTRLSTAPGFRDVRVRRKRKENQERLRITLRNPTPKELKEEPRPGPRIALTLPGRVLAASRGVAIDGRRITWSMSLREFARSPRVVLGVRYLIPT
jgi:hypothetical protein